MATECNTSKGMFLSRVVANQPLCREHWRCVLEVEGFPAAEPGQFVQILCGDPVGERLTEGIMLRRPFSIGGLRRSDGGCELDIIHRAIGRGTRWLSRLDPGARVSVLGPLGQPFPIPADRPLALLVGGGVGLPPLIWLAEALAAQGKQTVAFCGAKSADVLPLTRRPAVPISGEAPAPAFAEFAQFGVLVVTATDDGSLGARGMIPPVFARYLEGHAEQAGSMVVYSCGPSAMMREVARLCEQRSIPCLVCLERMMACGMGTCQSCVVRVRDRQAADGWRYRLCCTDGPVFDSRAVLWP